MAEDESTSDVGAVQVKSSSFERCFSAGSVCAFPVSAEAHPTSIEIPPGVSLTITTATYSSGRLDCAHICLRQDGNKRPFDWIDLCGIPLGRSLTGLALRWVGPQKVELRVRAFNGDVTVVGNVDPAAFEYSEPPLAGKQKFAPAQQCNETDESTSRVQVDKDECRSDTRQDSSKQGTKRKLSHVEDPKTPPSSPVDDIPPEEQQPEEKAPDSNPEETPQLSKKQRRKLAKKKAKELEEAVAFLNKHDSKRSSTSSKKDGATKVSLTKERRLPSGVIVRDIILGSGPTVKLGREISIHYKAMFTSGKVFDKSGKSPLTFRLGTGQVIPGLEKGLEGIKVGGEREITIPPKLGYGKKGSGTVVPPNSTLLFSVKVAK